MPRRQRTEKDVNYAIGTSVTNLLSLRQLAVPIPDNVVYDSASVRYALANGAQIADGYSYTDWIWDIISLPHVQTLLEFLGSDTAQYKSNIYIRTDRRDGNYTNPASSYEVFSSIMLRPALSGQSGVFVARSPYNVQNFKIRFVNLVVQSGYI